MKIRRAYNFRMPCVRNVIFAVLLITVVKVSAQEAQSPVSVSIAPAKLPKASLWNHYSFRFQAGGGVPPYHWRLVSGSLPKALTLQEDGQITGQVVQQGKADFVVAAVGQTGKSQQHQCTIEVETPLGAEWSKRAQVSGRRIDGSIKVSNTTGRDFELTFIVLAVNDIGRAIAIGYQHFSLKQNTRNFELPFGDTLSPGNYAVNVDVVGEEPQSNTIFRSRLVSGREAVTQGP